MINSNYPSEVIKMNFSELEIRVLCHLSDAEREMLYNNQAKRYNIYGKIERANLDLLPYELE